MRLFQFQISDNRARDLGRISRATRINKSECIRVALYPWLDAKLKEIDDKENIGSANELHDATFKE